MGVMFGVLLGLMKELYFVLFDVGLLLLLGVMMLSDII